MDLILCGLHTEFRGGIVFSLCDFIVIAHLDMEGPL